MREMHFFLDQIKSTRCRSFTRMRRVVAVTSLMSLLVCLRATIFFRDYFSISVLVCVKLEAELLLSGL